MKIERWEVRWGGSMASCAGGDPCPTRGEGDLLWVTAQLCMRERCRIQVDYSGGFVLMRENLGLLSNTCLQISPVSSERDHPYLFFKTLLSSSNNHLPPLKDQDTWKWPPLNYKQTRWTKWNAWDCRHPEKIEVVWKGKCRLWKGLNITRLIASPTPRL